MPSIDLINTLLRFDPDQHAQPAIALHVDVQAGAQEQELHTHRKGQLVLALQGAVMCEVEQAIWLVPTGHAVWIPGGVVHRNRITDNARLCFLFIEPGAVPMPDQCCTLLVSALVQELILHLAQQAPDYLEHSLSARLVALLFELLDKNPVERLYLPMSQEPRLHKITRAWSTQLSERRTLEQWADYLGMSSRSLARLVRQETGLSFGRWQQQWQLMVAMRLLGGGMAVQLVAAELGYNSVTAFITMFKKIMGQAPARYFASLNTKHPQ